MSPQQPGIQQVFERSTADCLRTLEMVCERNISNSNGSRCFTPIAEKWHPTNRHTPIDEMRKWSADLDPRHPAHHERIFVKHPRATLAPPYFDDL